MYTYICTYISSETNLKAAFLPADTIIIWFETREMQLQLDAFNHHALEGAM